MRLLGVILAALLLAVTASAQPEAQREIAADWYRAYQGMKGELP